MHVCQAHLQVVKNVNYISKRKEKDIGLVHVHCLVVGIKTQSASFINAIEKRQLYKLSLSHEY